MATNPLTRRALIEQIPTEEGQQAPAPRPAQGIHSTEVGRQAYNTAMALPGVGGLAKVASTGGLISRAMSAGASTGNTASRLTAGMATVPATTGLPAAAAAEAHGRAAAPAANTPLGAAGAGRGSINPPLASEPQPQRNIQSLAGQIRFDAGTNTYSGIDVGSNAQIIGGRGGGAISRQNMQAADQLAGDQNLASIQRIAQGGNVPQSPAAARLTAPTAEHSGNSWTARENLRRAKMDATSLIHQSHWAPRGSGLAAQAAYGRALAADQTAQGKQVDADVAAMHANAGLQQEQMRQDGANQRDGWRSLAEMARFNMDSQTQGFANRTAAQQEQLRNMLLDPNATPEQRSIAQRSLAALSGKSAADRMQTVTLPDTTNDMGQVVRGGQALVRLLEDGSVQQVPITGAQQGVSRAAPQEAITELRKNPASAAQFDAIFGVGASKQYLGR